MQNLKKHEKDKKTLFVSTPVLIALVKMSFFLHFSFLGLLQFPIFSEMFFDRFQKPQKSKNNKIPKQQKQKSNNNRKQYAKEKEMKDYDPKENKTTSRKTKKTK